MIATSTDTDPTPGPSRSSDVQPRVRLLPISIGRLPSSKRTRNSGPRGVNTGSARTASRRYRRSGVAWRGVVFYDSVGAFIDDAGFAYLPDGPSPDMANGSFENPQWFALGNHWYAWTASW